MEIDTETVNGRGDSGLAVAVASRVELRRPIPTPEAHPSLVVLRQPAGAAAEAIRSLYYALRQASGGAPLGLLGVCSSARREGRSTVAANLALMAARETGQPTALIDADLRAPSLATLLNVDGEVGLSDVLSNRADLEAAACDYGDTGVCLVPGGRPEPEPARKFTSPRFARFLAQIRQRFDEAIVDLPPLACVDSRLVARQCSGVVLLLRAGHTDGSLAREILIQAEGIRILGAVLNDASEAEAPVLRAARLALPGKS